MRTAGIRGADLDQEAIEEAISHLKGVFASQVVLDAHGQVQEIHAIGTTLRSAKQIVRDVETLLRVRFGVRIDYRKISLVQLDELGAQHTFSRPQLLTVRGQHAGNGYAVNVAVQQNGKEFSGDAVGELTLPARLKLAAQATLKAVGLLLPREGLIALADTRLIAMAWGEVALVTLVAWFPTGEERLLGVSVVRTEDDLAVEMLAAAARATLSALNRRLPLLLSSAAAAS